MKRGFLISLLLGSCALFAQTKDGSQKLLARTIPFDANWLFVKGDLTGAEQQNYNDTKWRRLNLPHDWSIEDLPKQTPDSIIGPFDKGSIGSTFTGFTNGGIGWYRKRFVTEKVEDNKQVTVYFDGVYMNSDVWLNGHHLGNHPHGYTPFFYDLTPYLKPAGQENTLAVQVRNEGKTARWYSGSGIYRHVWLTVTERVHVAPWGVYITTPDVSASKATVSVKTDISNKKSSGKNINLITTILSPAGKSIGNSQKRLTLEASSTKTGEQSIIVTTPVLWL